MIGNRHTTYPSYSLSYKKNLLNLDFVALGDFFLANMQVGAHEKMGMNIIPLKDLTPNESKTLTIDLLKNMDVNDPQNEKSRGQLIMEVMYKPFKEEDLNIDLDDDSAVVEKAPEGTPAGGGLLVVIIHEAQDLEGKYHTNPYVRLLFRGEIKKTKVKLSNLDFRASLLHLNN